jgi:DNA-binding CsgD family transcriptional regulator
VLLEVMPGGLFGRDDELQASASFLGADGPRALLLEGDAGIGKTALWREGLRLAKEQGCLVLACSGASDEARLSFAALADLLAPVLDVLGELPAPRRRALEVALLLRESDEPAPDDRAVAFAFADVLGRLAAFGRVVVAADDVQWLDAPSEATLAFAARRLAPTDPVALLLARRGGREEPFPLELERAVHCERIELGALSLGALDRLLRDRLGDSLPRPTLVRVHETCAGNPLFGIELARALLVRGAIRPPPGLLPVPARLTQLLRERIAALPEETRAPLLLIAVAGLASATTIGRALGRDPWELLRPALAEGLLEERGDHLAIAHPLLAAAMYESVDGDARRRAHRALAASTDELEECARHLALAAERPDSTAAQTLEEAAGQARRRGATASAAELLELALGLTPAEDREARSSRLVSAAEVLRDSGDWGRAQVLAGEAVETAVAGRDRAEALLVLATTRPGEVELCERALREAGHDRSLGARIRLVLAESLLLTDAAAALREARAALVDADAGGDIALQAQVLAMVGWLEGARADAGALRSLERAGTLERAGNASRGGFTSEFNLASVRMWRDELDLSRDGFLRQLARAEERGDVYELTHVLLHLAQVEWRAGEWRRAASYADQARENWSGSGDTQGWGAVIWVWAVLAAHRGDLDAARDAVRDALRRHPEDMLNHARHHWVLGFAALCERRIGDALSSLESAAGLFDKVGIVDPGLRLFAADLIEARVAAGRLAEARTEAEAIFAAGQALDRPRALAIGLRGLALVLAAEGELTESLVLLEQALAAHDRLPVPFERGRTLLALGRVQRRAKQRGAAHESLEQARDLFDALGARLLADQARQELQRVGGRRHSEQLTTAEARVAELAARGLPNKEIAAILFVTVKTVEGALSRVYRKLGVRSRAELAHKTAGASKL